MQESIIYIIPFNLTQKDDEATYMVKLGRG